MEETVGPDELRVEVVLGPDVQLSAAVRAALEDLARALDDEAGAGDEVAGFAFQPGLQVGGLARPGAAGVARGGAASCVVNFVPGEPCTIHVCLSKAGFTGGAAL